MGYFDSVGGVEPPEDRFASDDYRVDPNAYGGDHRASDLSAAINRAQWEDYLGRFTPLEDELVQGVMSGERLDDALGGVSSSVNNSFGVSKASRGRDMGRYGVSLTGQTQQATDTSFNNRQAGTEAAARNYARKSVEDSNTRLITGAGQTPVREEQ